MMGIRKWWEEVQEEHRQREAFEARRWHSEDPEECRQTVLFAGMDCLPGQLDLFETDGKEANNSDRAWPSFRGARMAGRKDRQDSPAPPAAPWEDQT